MIISILAFVDSGNTWKKARKPVALFDRLVKIELKGAISCKQAIPLLMSLRAAGEANPGRTKFATKFTQQASLAPELSSVWSNCERSEQLPRQPKVARDLPSFDFAQDRRRPTGFSQ
jgi:hypothetical protein